MKYILNIPPREMCGETHIYSIKTHDFPYFLLIFLQFWHYFDTKMIILELKRHPFSIGYSALQITGQQCNFVFLVKIGTCRFWKKSDIFQQKNDKNSVFFVKMFFFLIFKNILRFLDSPLYGPSKCLKI